LCLTSRPACAPHEIPDRPALIMTDTDPKHMDDPANSDHVHSQPTAVETSRATSPGGDAVYQNGVVTPTYKDRRNRPRTFPYFETLPYEVETDQRRQEDFSEILKHLYIAVEAGDFTPGAVHWTRELRSWLSLKFDPTKEQRIKLAKLYYELALAPGVEPSVAERFASMFMMLTKYVLELDMHPAS